MNEILSKQKSSIKNIMEVAPKHCENCGHKYAEGDFKIMKNTNFNTLLHLKCSQCGSTYMLNVMNPVQGMIGASRMPVNLDISDSIEMAKFAGQTPVENDDAIDVYDLTDVDNFDNFLQELEDDKPDIGNGFDQL